MSNNRHYIRFQLLLLKLKRISKVTWIYIITLTCMLTLLLKNSSHHRRRNRRRGRKMKNNIQPNANEVLNNTQPIKEYIELSRQGKNEGSLLSKTFPYWGGSEGGVEFPCYPGHSNFQKEGTQLRGLIYIRIHKSFSSTLAGINIRIASHKNYQDERCGCTWDHTEAHLMSISKRNKAQSILWSFVREPSKRFVSDFFYFAVSRRGNDPEGKMFNLLAYHRPIKSSNYQLRYLHPDKIPFDVAFGDVDQPDLISNATKQVQTILNEYDFIGVTERFDESIVAMQLLFHLDVHDILSLLTNKGGGWDSVLDEFGKRCFKIQKSYMTEEMKTFFKTNEWYKRNAGDYLLYQAANRSLDLTIEHTIGRKKFDEALKVYLGYKERTKVCEDKVLFPCNETGRFQRGESSKNCYFDDLGCGYPCLDTIL